MAINKKASLTQKHNRIKVVKTLSLKGKKDRELFG